MDSSSLPAIDQHAHNVLDADPADAGVFLRAFSEAGDPRAVEEARFTLSYRRGLRDVGELLGVEPAEEMILARRAELGLEALTRLCLDASRLEALLLDDGFLAESSLPTAWHGRFVPVHRVLRVETVAEDLLAECEHFDDFEGRLLTALERPGDGVVAFKSIACYRSGLDVRAVAAKEVREAFLGLKRRFGQRRSRLSDKAVIDYLVRLTLWASARGGLPVQLHTGFGDPDLDLRLANPLHLRAVLEEAEYRDARVVLLHASYPFAREAGYLASVYPQVYLDLGLAIPLLSVNGMREAAGQLVELAPWSKLCYSSDAHLIPEMFYLGARWGRRVLCTVLEEAVRDGDLTAAEADEAARAILADNARRLYGLRVQER